MERERRRRPERDERVQAPPLPAPRLAPDLTPDSLRALQRGAGNRAVARMIGDKADKGTRVERHTDRAQFEVVRRLESGGLKYEVTQVAAPPTAEAPAPAVETPAPAVANAGPPVPGAGPPPPAVGPPTAVTHKPRAMKRRTGPNLVKDKGREAAEAAEKEEAKSFGVQVRSDDPVWGLVGDEASYRFFVETVQRRNEEAAETKDRYLAEAKAKDLSKPFEGMADYTFEYWFNYFWEQVPASRRKVELHTWARETYSLLTPIDEMRAALCEMVDLGFIRVSPSELVKHQRAYEAAQSPARPGANETDYTAPELPSLRATGLAYRNDSRPPEKVTEHQGFHAATQQPNGEGLRKSRNLDAKWHPFAQPGYDGVFLRRGDKDNDLQSLVSIAVDPRDAVRFPLPGSEMQGGQRLMGTEDEVNLYVVWVGAAEIVNTSQMVKDRLAADVFGRGEIAVQHLPRDHILLHARVRRRFAEANVGYIAGEVVQVTRMWDQRTAAGLPAVTVEALRTVEDELRFGALRFLENGAPAVGNQDHQRIKAALEARRAGAPSASGTLETAAVSQGA